MLHSFPSDNRAGSQSSRSLFLFYWYHLFSLKQQGMENSSWEFHFLRIKWKQRFLPCLLILKLKRKLRLLMLGHCSFQVNSLLFKFDKKFYIISNYFLSEVCFCQKCVNAMWGKCKSIWVILQNIEVRYTPWSLVRHELFVPL